MPGGSRSPRMSCPPGRPVPPTVLAECPGAARSRRDRPRATRTRQSARHPARHHRRLDHRRHPRPRRPPRGNHPPPRDRPGMAAHGPRRLPAPDPLPRLEPPPTTKSGSPTQSADCSSIDLQSPSPDSSPTAERCAPIAQFGAPPRRINIRDVGTPNTSSRIGLGEVSAVGYAQGCSSGDPQQPSRRLVASCRWPRSWRCAGLTAWIACPAAEPPGRGWRQDAATAGRDVRDQVGA